MGPGVGAEKGCDYSCEIFTALSSGWQLTRFFGVVLAVFNVCKVVKV